MTGNGGGGGGAAAAAKAAAKAYGGGAYHSSPALLTQNKMVEGPAAVADYVVFTPPEWDVNEAIELQNPIVQLQFAAMRARAGKGDKRSVFAMWELLKKTSLDQSLHTTLRVQLSAEYGVDPESDEARGAPATARETDLGAHVDDLAPVLDGRQID